MEGSKVFLCRWKKVGKRYTLWLDAKSEVAVEDLDFEEGSEALAERVACFYNDYEAVLEFDPPKPGDAGGGSPEILVLGYNESVDAAGIAEDMFSGGLCPNCKTPIGARTEKQLITRQLPKNNVAGVRNRFPGIFLFSEEFTNLMTPEDRANLQLREISSESVGRKRFFEVTGDPIARFIGVKGATYSPLSCWACPVCNASKIAPRMPPGKMFSFFQFVCCSDLPNPIPTAFVLGRHGMSLTPCMLKSRWREIVGKPGTKGVATHPVGLVGSDLADYHPPLPIYKGRSKGVTQKRVGT